MTHPRVFIIPPKDEWPSLASHAVGEGLVVAWADSEGAHMLNDITSSIAAHGGSPCSELVIDLKDEKSGA